MGYPLSPSGRAAFRSLARQTVSIAVSPVVGDPFTITEADIRQGGMKIDRFSAYGTAIELGACSSAELSLTLDNTSGKFTGVVFEGAQMVVTVSCSDGVNTYSVPMGYFTVDEAPKMRQIINLVALDRMVQFDKELSPGDFVFPITVEALVCRLCADCNVVLSPSVDFSSLANASISLFAPGGDRYTYRELLIWCCQILGVCGYMDWDGELRLEWYHNDSTDDDAGALGLAYRFSSDYDEGVISITGVQYTQPDGTVVLSGTDAYVLDLSSNLFLGQNPAEMLPAIYSAIDGTSYTPLNASCVPLPWVWPLDKVWYDYAGVAGGASSLVTNATFSLNGRTFIRSIGKSQTRKGYATANPLTAQEQAVIRSLEQAQADRIDAKTLSVLQFNDLITNALGLYSTTVPAQSGNVYYLHDQPELEESMVIFTGTDAGIAWTDTGWNAGSPVWKYGVTAAGAAFFKTLAADRISADWVQTGILQSTDGSTFFLDLDNGILNMDVNSLRLNGEEMSLIIQGVADDAAEATEAVQADLDDLRAHIVIGSDGSMTFIGAEGNPITLRLTSNAVEIYNGGSVIDTFGSGGTVTENLTIASGGSLSISPYKWITRSNGHLQLVFVG